MNNIEKQSEMRPNGDGTFSIVSPMRLTKKGLQQLDSNIKDLEIHEDWLRKVLNRRFKGSDVQHEDIVYIVDKLHELYSTEFEKEVNPDF